MTVGGWRDPNKWKEEIDQLTIHTKSITNLKTLHGLICSVGECVANGAQSDSHGETLLYARLRQM